MPKFRVECTYCGSIELRYLFSIEQIKKCFRCGDGRLKIQTAEDLDVYGYDKDDKGKSNPS